MVEKKEKPKRRRLTRKIIVEEKKAMTVHMTVKEYEKIKKFADKAGMGVSGFCAQIVLNHLKIT